MAAKASEAKQLERAIHSASKELLQRLMAGLCNQFPDVRKNLATRLLTTQDDVEEYQVFTDADETEIDSEASGNDDDSKNTGEKRKSASSNKTELRLRHAICENCDEEFDILNNTKESCCYHPCIYNVYGTYPLLSHSLAPGANSESIDEAVPDDDFTNHDENRHGIIDCDETQLKYPDGFFYECCDGTGDEKLCTVDRHRETSSKRRRVY
ncbi:hypothetical protein EMCG_05849 [[Emmonsia] crescens]|uniref:C2H2-type domain-containing protein n=1 Tax=[Emmonsia] crescens TaxID=73230 RepID=A0A0G2IDY3_9EURO|nr:hypothetical protein EMCG_05849 [Emmonsia crescens UAMH 3008]